ncbi:uncharacterized protein LOC115951961 [Quercus lobata]|uniref:uncharacterized protein LOC115951961 n=1 Tax=Quercus lobata TaxID=97700 RepID=UPI001248260E|nr:uncharacterized protein LOC115951961 [Quercus lobata]
MSIARLLTEDSNHEPKKARMEIRPSLSFSDENKIGTIWPHDDALVVTLRIGGYDVKRILIDQGSGAEIIFLDLYKGFNLKLEDLTAYDSHLVSFDGKVVILIDQIRFPVQVGLEVMEVDFIVVDVYSPYTAIVARPWLYALGAISSTLHLKVKYLSRDQIEEFMGSQSMARQCLVGAQLPPLEKEELLAFLRRNIDAVSEEAKCERLEEIAIDGNPEKFFQNTYEAPGVDPYFICHHLNVNPAVLSRKQPPRRSSKKHSDAIKEKVNKLKHSGAIKEVFYPEWLANIVVVKKKNEKWQQGLTEDFKGAISLETSEKRDQVASKA